MEHVVLVKTFRYMKWRRYQRVISDETQVGITSQK
jgi:hypothetical protein